MTKSMTENEDKTYNVAKLPDFDIKVVFNDYILKSKSDRTTEAQLGLGTSWDILTAVKYVHTDMTEREQLATSARVKIENGYDSVSQAELSALQAENLETNDMLIEQKTPLVAVNETVNSPVIDEKVIPDTEETPEE